MDMPHHPGRPSGVDHTTPMIGENWQLVIDELVEFEK